MRVLLQPTAVVPATLPPDQILAAGANGTPVVTEPGYDFDPLFFNGNAFGFLQLRQAPAISVSAITFNYPEPTDVLWTIPNDWIRLDQKPATINLVPTTNPATLPFSAMFLQTLTGSRLIPLMMQITYMAGLADAAVDYPDLIDVIKKACVISLIEDQYFPASSSVSGDGLSQSMSMDVSKYQEQIDRRIDRLRSQIRGIRLAVM
jgi:hypothetical protein